MAVESETATEVGNQWWDWEEEEPALAQVRRWVTEGRPPGPEERKVSLPAVRHLLKECSRLHIQEDMLKCSVLEHHTGSINKYALQNMKTMTPLPVGVF